MINFISWLLFGILCCLVFITYSMYDFFENMKHRTIRYSQEIEKNSLVKVEDYIFDDIDIIDVKQGYATLYSKDKILKIPYIAINPTSEGIEIIPHTYFDISELQYEN